MPGPDLSSILLGTNGEPREKPAIRFAGLEACATGRPVRVVHVVQGTSPTDPHRPLLYSYAPVDEEAHRTCLRVAARVHEMAPGPVHVEVETPRGLTVHQLLAHAQRAHLLVLQGGRTRASHPLSASTNAALASRAPVPVVSMPMTWDAASIGRVVVGVGALPRPPRLIDRALELAGEHKVPLLIVHALDFPAVPGTESASEQARRRRQVKAEIDLALAPLRRRHGRVHLDVVVTHGTPEETLGDVLEQADLLVLGRRDTDRPSYEHLGSLTRHMMRSANVPVVVVPRPLDAAMARPLMSTSQEKGVTPAS